MGYAQRRLNKISKNIYIFNALKINWSCKLYDKLKTLFMVLSTTRLDAYNSVCEAHDVPHYNKKKIQYKKVVIVSILARLSL